MDNLLQDLRYGLRSIARNPAFAAVIIVILAVAIGANTAVFSFVNAVLLRPLPFPEPDHLVVLTEQNLEKGRFPGVVSPRNLEDWEKRCKSFAAFGAWRDWRFRFTTPEGATIVSSAIATPSFFDVLGVKPALGRNFLPEENQPGRDHVVMINQSFWQNELGGNPNIIGQSIVLDNESFTVIGVLPANLSSLWLSPWKIWAPVSVDPDQTLGRHQRNRQVYARLKSGVSLKQAQMEMDVISQQLAQEYPKEDAGWTASVMSLHSSKVRDVSTALWVFLGAVTLVLLIACANVANLMLVRATKRRKEFAIRASVGAGTGRLVRQMLTESLALSVLGGLAGLLLANWIIDLLVSLSAGLIPKMGEIRLDKTVLIFTLIVSMLTGIVFGLAPAIQASRIDLVTELKDGQRPSISGLGFSLRGFLVVCQVALSLVLLIGAGLLGRSFLSLTTLTPGYNPEKLLTLMAFPVMENSKDDQLAQLYDRLTDELHSVSGVVSVGATSAGPEFGGYESIEIIPEGYRASTSAEFPQARYFNIGPNYFHTLETSILRGREFTNSDRRGAQSVVIINQTMAQRFWPNENPVGKHITLVRQNELQEIVGVVADIKHFDISDKMEPEVYWPYMQKVRGMTYFTIRTSGNPADLAIPITKRIYEFDPSITVLRVTPMDQLIGNSLKNPRFNLVLLGIFAGIALLLASVGLYGVISYLVAQRTHEIGIRMALGAQKSDVLRLVVGQGMVLTSIGIVVGLVGALAITRLLASMLYQVGATDPATFGSLAALLAVIALLACYMPARRAARVNPIEALRYE